MMELKDRIAIVTGAGRGIGRAIAVRLAREGAKVVVNSITKASAEKTALEIERMGFSTHPFPVDVTVRQNAFELVDWTASTFGGVDILVNNVGFASHMLVEDMPPELWDRHINVNLTTPFNLAKAALRHMIPKRRGKIAFIGSVAARRIGGIGSAEYTAGKHGTRGFAKHLAYEVARHGINVNMVNPGITLTDMLEGSTTEEHRKALAEDFPMGRLTLPEDIAEAVLFLVSERSRQITGHSINVEGGALIMYSSGYSTNIKRREEMSKRMLAEWEAPRPGHL
jgi:3-oxoacyl-[acyl-carrier protein] reductase